LDVMEILIADDHPLLRQGIRHLLEREPDLRVVAEAGDGEEAVSLAESFHPNVVIMDIGLPKLNGLEATRRIKASHPSIAVLVFTVYDDEEYILGLLEAGATGYLRKNAYGEELTRAIRDVSAGVMVFDPNIGRSLLNRASQSSPVRYTSHACERLTPREAAVLTCAARGMSNQEIALHLNIRLRTVKGHLVSIFAKMGVNNRMKAVMQAIQSGFITTEE